MTLCNPGEMIITEEWTYPSALASARPWGVHAAPIKMDHEGMRSDDLRKVLSEWDESARGAPRLVQIGYPLLLLTAGQTSRYVYRSRGSESDWRCMLLSLNHGRDTDVLHADYGHHSQKGDL